MLSYITASILFFRMDSFLGLFDPGEESQLPPEPQVGNVEYKLKLVNPSKLRFEHLVTQVLKLLLFTRPTTSA